MMLWFPRQLNIFKKINIHLASANPKGKKLKHLGILGEIFQTRNKDG